MNRISIGTTALLAAATAVVAQAQALPKGDAASKPAHASTTDCSTVLARQRSPEVCAAQDAAKRSSSTVATNVNSQLIGRGVSSVGPVSASAVKGDPTAIEGAVPLPAIPRR